MSKLIYKTPTEVEEFVLEEIVQDEEVLKRIVDKYNNKTILKLEFEFKEGVLVKDTANLEDINHKIVECLTITTA
jgi:hypothetical protein